MASSSGAGIVVAAMDSDVAATHLPHQGHLKLLQSCGRWVLKHSITCELVDLPEARPTQQRGPWELHYDDDGFAMAMREGPDADDFDLVSVEAALSQVAWKSTLGDILLDVSLGGEPSLAFLADLQNEHQMMQVHAREVGPLCSAMQTQVALYSKHTRCGCKILWSMPDIYKALGFGQAYTCTASSWLLHWREAWERWLLGFFDSCFCVQRSQQYSRAGAELDRSRHLPWLAASTVALLGLLFHWLSATKKEGGLQSHQALQSIELLIRHLLVVATAVPWATEVHLDMDCRCESWPLLASGRCPFALYFLPGAKFMLYAGSEDKNPVVWRTWLE